MSKASEKRARSEKLRAGRVSGAAALAAPLALLAALPGLATRAAPDVAVTLRKEIVAQTKRGEGPDGKKWKPGQEGVDVLQHVEKALRVTARGTTIVASLSGHNARHSLGAVRGGVRRQIMPTLTLPDPVIRAIKAVIEAEIKATVGAG